MKCSNRFWMRNWSIQIIELILLLCRGDIFALKWTYCALSYTIIIIIDRECKARLLPSSINCGPYISFPDTIQVQGTRNLLSKIRMWERIHQSRFENVLSGRTGYLKLYMQTENHCFKYRYVAINSLVLGLRLWLMRWMPPHWILKYLRFQNALLKIIILSKVVACIQICRIESLIEKDGSEISAVPQHQQTKTLSNNNDAYTKFDQIHGAYLFCSLCIKARCLLKKIIFSKPWLNNR